MRKITGLKMKKRVWGLISGAVVVLLFLLFAPIFESTYFFDRNSGRVMRRDAVLGIHYRDVEVSSLLSTLYQEFIGEYPEPDWRDLKDGWAYARNGYRLRLGFYETTSNFRYMFDRSFPDGNSQRFETYSVEFRNALSKPARRKVFADCFQLMRYMEQVNSETVGFHFCSCYLGDLTDDVIRRKTGGETIDVDDLLPIEVFVGEENMPLFQSFEEVIFTESN